MALALLLAPGLARAKGPTAPCPGESAAPAYPALGAPPAIALWYGGDLDGWEPGACTGWAAARFNVLVATAGRFPSPGGGDAILGRFAQTSKIPGITYWSVTRHAWRPLIHAAYALSAADRNARRDDFALSELGPGATALFFQDEETPAGALVYRLEVRERTADRLVVALANAERVRMLLVPLFDPGEYQFVYFFERESGEVWRYYALARAGGAWNPIVRLGSDSYINRAAALFRYLTGLALNQEPPAAP